MYVAIMGYPHLCNSLLMLEYAATFLLSARVLKPLLKRLESFQLQRLISYICAGIYLFTCPVIPKPLTLTSWHSSSTGSFSL